MPAFDYFSVSFVYKIIYFALKQILQYNIIKNVHTHLLCQ